MPALEKFNYYRRIFRAYLLPGQSQLSFWHDAAELNPRASTGMLGEYYMNFAEKARYAGPTDPDGIPKLNYHGTIGPQYNPIAIAQWGLGNFNLYKQGFQEQSVRKFLLASDWLCVHLEENAHGVSVWNHYFDWEYRSCLRSPWYSGLAQGQAISLLVRAHAESGQPKYLKAATSAFQSFLISVKQGGVTFTDARGGLWFEEYIVTPPTHILNGFIWALWGIYDFLLATNSADARHLFSEGVKTLVANLQSYDLGFWSLYEQSGTRLPMIASPFYHRLHVTQLGVMHRLTGEPVFAQFADRWQRYACSRSKRTRALCYKGAFKLCHY
ncbi:MAG TPA: D-glucuronyl C5-epimerase family protein [Terriglobales bacterium]|nr:D-glucuronyl C5-epimerase family protein [Terriglobales bacterium]